MMISRKSSIIIALCILCLILFVSLVSVTTILALKPANIVYVEKKGETVLDSDVANKLAYELLARINFSVDPCNNFYEFACGHWKLDHPMPADRSNWNAELLISEDVGNEIVDAFGMVDLSSASNGLKFAKNFYDKCMNLEEAEKTRAIWLGKLLHLGKAEDSGFFGFEDGLGKWPLIDDSYSDPPISIEKQIGQLKSQFGIDTFIYTYAMESEENSYINILWSTCTFLPLGMGLAESALDYYLDDSFKDILKAYSDLQLSIAQLLAKDSGFTNVKINQTDLSGMLQVEKQLAQIINDTMDEDDEALRNIGGLGRLVPDFKWKEFFDGLFSERLIEYVTNNQVIWVSEPTFAKKLAELFKRTPRRHLQNFMIWRLIMYNLPFLSSDYKAAYNKFKQVLSGKNLTEKPQKSTCVSFVRGNYELPNLGFGSAEALALTKFSRKEMNQATNLTSHIVNSIYDMITNELWMDLVTRKKALEKVEKLESLIAYPNWITNTTEMNDYYKALSVSYSVSFGTLNLAVRGWAVRKNFEAIGNLTDRLSFQGSPVLTNAWYQPSKNSIVIPIGELNRPAFGQDYPNNIVYGALGALIGHEISHGFYDPVGAEFDGTGNKVNWWSDGTRENFQFLQTCWSKQYDKYCYPNEIGCVNGNKTLSENAADLAGLKAAFGAYVDLEKQRLAKAQMFTSDQLFFLSFPLYFCGEQTDSSLKSQLLYDNHTPAMFRVNGVLRNMPDFATAFNCPKKSFMNPPDPCYL